MIIAVGSDKGSPGATTLTTSLGLMWPGERLVCELDPRGADLPFRLLGANGQHLAATPSLATLAVDARPGALPPNLVRYSQPTALGVPVIRGEVSTRAAGRVAPHLPAIANVAAAWQGVALCDLGSLQATNPALVVAKAASIVLLVMRASTEGLGHLRDRVEELSGYVGNPDREWTPLGVVLVASAREAGAATRRTRALLDSIGSPVPVAGVFHYDQAGATSLWAGQPGKRITKGPIARSTGTLISNMRQLWPHALDEVVSGSTAVANRHSATVGRA
jgi:hypothetical protein